MWRHHGSHVFCRNVAAAGIHWSCSSCGHVFLLLLWSLLLLQAPTASSTCGAVKTVYLKGPPKSGTTWLEVIIMTAVKSANLAVSGKMRGRGSFLEASDPVTSCPLLRTTADLKHHPPHDGGQNPVGLQAHPAILAFAECSGGLANGSSAALMVPCLPRAWRHTASL